MDPDARTSFACLLKEYRVAQRLSQEALAERAGLSREAINLLERGRRLRPRRDTVILLARTLNLSPDERARLLAAAAAQRGHAAIATSSRPSSLPPRLTSFIGRASEITEVRTLLRSKRLVTLTGVGGIGKTSLALAVAAAVQAQFAHGVVLVELAALTDGELVPHAVAAALGVRERPGVPILTTLGAALGMTPRLLVVDNCEHLVLSCAQLVETLLRACPRLTVLVTSREPLRVGAEVIWRVPTLTVPDDDTPPVEVLARSDAVCLFVARAAAVGPGFALDAENAGTIAAICRRLDGIPLALELAAARTTVLSVAQIAARLDDCFPLLTGGSRTAVPRQQTLQATLEWSYNLLSDPERAFFRQISVFAGGFSLDGAEAICSPAAPTDGGSSGGVILDLVAQLVDKSLVLVETRVGDARYRLLETVRQYGHARLVETGEAAATWDRLAAWCLTLAEAAEVELTGPRQGAWLERLAREQDNLRAALTWSQEHAPDVEIRLAGSLWRFWRMRSPYTEGLRWLDGALTRTMEGSAARAKALYGAGILAREHGDYQTAWSWLEECVAWWRQAEAKGPLGHVLHDLGLCYFLVSTDDARIKAVWEESLALLEEVGDERGVGFSVLFLGRLAGQTGADDTARELIGNAIQIFRRVGDAWSLSEALGRLGEVLIRQGDLPRARQVVDEQLALARRLGNRFGMGIALCGLARVARADGDLDRAAHLFNASLRVCHAIGSTVIYDVMRDLGVLAVQRGRFSPGVRLLSAARRSPHGTGMYARRQVDDQPSLAVARAVLGDDAFDYAWAEGQAMTVDQAVALALEKVGG